MVHGQPSSRVLTSAGPGLGHPFWAQIFWWHYPSYLLPVLSALSREMLALPHQNGIFLKTKKQYSFLLLPWLSGCACSPQISSSSCQQRPPPAFAGLNGLLLSALLAVGLAGGVWDPPPWDPPGPHCWAGAAVMGVGSAAGCCGVPPIKGVIAGLARQRCSLIRGVQGFALQSSRI